MSLFAKDSLINLRVIACKNDGVLPTAAPSQNALFASRASSMASLGLPGSSNNNNKRFPVDDLKLRVLAKRQKLSESSSHPSSSSSSSQTPKNQKKKVTFALQKNQIQYHHWTTKDLAQAWLSPAESDTIRDSLLLTVATFRAGCLDTSKQSMRGLEYRVTSAITQDKIHKNQHFRSLLLGQQQFFKGLIGKANERMLSKLSQVLSADDVKEAIALAEGDEKVARRSCLGVVALPKTSATTVATKMAQATTTTTTACPSVNVGYDTLHKLLCSARMSQTAPGGVLAVNTSHAES